MPRRWATGPSHFLFLSFVLAPNYIVSCNAGRQPPKCIYLSSHNGCKQLKARDCHIYPISLLAQQPNEDQRHNKESIPQARSRQRKSNTQLFFWTDFLESRHQCRQHSWLLPCYCGKSEKLQHAQEPQWPTVIIWTFTDKVCQLLARTSKEIQTIQRPEAHRNP